ncbi:unnamed protein product [Effrenium voratum]|nr:unnamed protein product [Effrenium voratum]
MAPEKRVPVQGDWISGSSMAALAFLLQVTEDDEDEALEAEALDGPGVELGAGRGLLGLGCAAAGMLVEVTDLEEEICGALRRSVGASDLGAGCAVRRFDWDEGLEAYGGLQPPNENLAPRLVLGAELLWAEDAVDPLLEAVLPVVLAGASFVYGFSQRPSNELFMRKLQAVEGTRLERRSFRVETKCLGCGGWQTREQCSVAIWSCIEPPFSGKMGLLAGWLVGRVVAFLATILSTRPRCPGRSFGDFGEASVGRWVLRCTGWWHAVPQPGLVARTLEFPSLGGDGLGVHFAWKAEGRRPKSENLGVSLELAGRTTPKGHSLAVRRSGDQPTWKIGCRGSLGVQEPPYQALAPLFLLARQGVTEPLGPCLEHFKRLASMQCLWRADIRRDLSLVLVMLLSVANSLFGGVPTGPYEVLGIGLEATAEEIKRAYKCRALQWHPDKHPPEVRQEREQQFKALSGAYETLRHPEKRRQYDQMQGLADFLEPSGSARNLRPEPFEMRPKLAQRGHSRFEPPRFGARFEPVDRASLNGVRGSGVRLTPSQLKNEKRRRKRPCGAGASGRDTMGIQTVPINEEIMRLGSWRQVLQHALKRGEFMDELNAVTALHRAAKLYREDDGGRTPLEEIHQDPGFQNLLELTRHFVQRCRPQQIANALWAFAVLNFQPKELLQLLCRYGAERLDSFLPQNVSNSIWALGTLGFAYPRLLELVPRHVEANVRDYTPQDLSNTCWAYARLQQQCDPLFRLIIKESLIQLPRFKPQNMSNLVWACATVMYKDEAAMRTIASFACTRVAEFGTQELSNLTWGLATLGILCEDWMDCSGAEMAKRSAECCPQDLSNTLWAYGTLKHKVNEHLRVINWEVMRQIEWFSPQGLSNVIWGLSAIKYRDIKALTCISEEVIRRPAEQLTPSDISTLLYSFAVLAWQHEDAVLKLRRCVRLKMSQLQSRDVANVSWALVTLSHRDDGLFRLLMEKAGTVITEFTVAGLCNVAWAFVRFGLDVPKSVAQGIAEETLRMRPEFVEEPGSGVLLSDAVCSEWVQHVSPSLFQLCDQVGREPYEAVKSFLEDWENIPALGCSQGEAERFQARVTGFKTIQLGRRMTCELLRGLGMLEEDPELFMPLRRMREEWLLRNIQALYEQDPNDATMKHKTTCTYQLRLGSGWQGPAVTASGTPMEEPIRFVACVVEHSRSNDAEFQVLNKAADQLLGSGITEGLVRLDVSEMPCLSCLGALRQFQKSFPKVQLCVSFSIRKVSDMSEDCDDINRPLPVPQRQPTDLPPPSQDVLDNRGRGRAPPPPQQVSAPARKWRRPPEAGNGHVAPKLKVQDHTPIENGKDHAIPQEVARVSVYEQVKRKDWGQSFY